MPYNFAPASRFDAIVHGAERPGYHENEQPARAIPGWIDFMKERGIQQVVCLLSDDQLAYYGNVSLIRAYDAAFPYKTVHVPIPDFSVPLPEQVDRVLRVLNEAFEQHRPIVVHARQGWGERVRCLRRGCAFGTACRSRRPSTSFGEAPRSKVLGGTRRNPGGVFSRFSRPSCQGGEWIPLPRNSNLAAPHDDARAPGTGSGAVQSVR